MIVNSLIVSSLFAVGTLVTLMLLLWGFRAVGLGSLSRPVCLALATTAVLAWCLNIAVVDRFSSRLPFWDEWGAEGWHLYRPFLEGRLPLADLFASHNEHRIFTTRLAHLMLFIVNGQWDPKLQMALGAGVHMVALLLMGLSLWNAAGRTRSATFSVLVFAIAVIPFGAFNLLSGFQLQFYLLQLYSVLAIIILADAKSATAMAVGTIAGLAALMSLGSGVLAALACLPVLIVSGFWAMRSGEKGGAHWRAAGCCLLLIMVGAALTTAVPSHQLLKAHSLGDFLTTFGFCTSWPFPVPWMGFLVWLPWLADVGRTFIKRKGLTPADRLVMMMGIWVLLQCAAVAYSRNRDGSAPDSRYMDAIIIGLAVNLASLTRVSFGSGRGKLAEGAWVVAIFAALCVPATGKVWEECAKRARYAAYQSDSVHRFLAGDKQAIYNQDHDHIPFPDEKVLEMYLTDPEMLALLPPPWGPVAVNLSSQGDRVRGFTTGLVDPLGKSVPRMQIVSNFWPSEEVGIRRWRSVSYDAFASGWLLWEVCGYPNVKGEIQLNHSATQQTTVSIPRNPGNEWQEVATRAPRWSWRVDLTQRTSDSWMALRGPWKIGGGSALLVWICLYLPSIIGGLVLLLLFQAMWTFDSKKLAAGTINGDSQKP